MISTSLGQGRGVVSWVLALIVLAVAPLTAQVDKAALSGTAVDTSGAVVVGAKISAKNVDTGISYAGLTDAQGRYTISQLPVGAYEVSALKAGFEKIVQSGITLTVGSHPVLDFKLPVGRTEEVVEVQGQASRVETESSAVEALIAPAQMENLPLNGRNFTDLLSLAPGVQTVPSGATGGGTSASVYGEGTNYSVSGSRPVGQAYMLDDTDVRNVEEHGAGIGVMGTSLGMDAIQEFSILTNTYSAEFGGTGAAINAVTKSGTNALHGSAYEYLRNSALDAMNYFDVPGTKPSFKRNQFGGTLGGPIKKDKAFFFVNYEGLRAGQGETYRSVVPDYSAGNNFFMAANQYAALFGETVTTVPLTLAQVEANPTLNGSAGVTVPQSTLSMLSLLPAAQSAAQCPNVSGLSFSLGTALSCDVQTYIGKEDYAIGRVDYTLGAKDSLFGRYVLDHAYQYTPSSFSPGWPEVDYAQNQYFTLEERHTFSTHLLNSVRFGLVRLAEDMTEGGVNGHSPISYNAGRPDPGVAIYTLTGLGGATSSPFVNDTNRLSVGDDLVTTIGKHDLRFGGIITRVQSNLEGSYGAGGYWFFSFLYFPAFGGSPAVGALVGMPNVYMGAAGSGWTYPSANGQTYAFSNTRDWRQTRFSPYIQDDWKIARNLTVNLGLRYEFASNPTTVGLPPFALINPLADAAYASESHLFQSNPNRFNFDPRIGLAWDPFGDHKTSIRAGFGMFHEPVTARTFAQSAYGSGPNPVNPQIVVSPTLGQAGGASGTWAEMGSLFPNLPSDYATYGSLKAQFYGMTWNTDKSPYMQQFNLNVQRELGHGMVAQVGYNGSAGVHMFSEHNINLPLAWSDVTPLVVANLTPTQLAQWKSDQINFGAGSPNPATGQGARGSIANPFTGILSNQNFNFIDATEPTAHSSYNSLQASLSRQFAKSLLGNLGYTWSKCLDDGSSTNSYEQGSYAVYDDWNQSLDRGPCTFNASQVFKANAIYQLPFKGNRVVAGWALSPILSRNTGLPIDVQSSAPHFQANTDAGVNQERPNLVPGCDPTANQTINHWYNPDCYVMQPYGTLGDAGRNSLVNPNYFNLDLSIFKDTKLTEKVAMQFRAEFFNVLNHPSFNVGQQAFVLSAGGSQVTPSAVAQALPGVSYMSAINNPANYQPTVVGGAPGGALCVSSILACYTTNTAAMSTLSTARQIQFALRFTF
jgi:hypothetical protein